MGVQVLVDGAELGEVETGADELSGDVRRALLGGEDAQLAVDPLDIDEAGRGEQRGGAVRLRAPHREVQPFGLAQLPAVELFEQVAFVHDADAVGEVRDLGEDVAGHEDGHALLAGERTQQLADLDDARRVEGVGRLVEDEQLGPVQQGSSRRPAACCRARARRRAVPRSSPGA